MRNNTMNTQRNSTRVKSPAYNISMTQSNLNHRTHDVASLKPKGRGVADLSKNKENTIGELIRNYLVVKAIYKLQHLMLEQYEHQTKYTK